MSQCGFPNDKTELLPADHKTSCIFLPSQTRMNPLKCELGFADPLFLSVSCIAWKGLCWSTVDHWNLLPQEQLLQHFHLPQVAQASCLQWRAPAPGVTMMGSGSCCSEGSWPVQSGAASNGNTASTAFHRVGRFALPGQCPWKSLSSFLGREEQKSCQALLLGPLTLLCHDQTPQRS